MKFKIKSIIASILLGIGLSSVSIFIFAASLLVKTNLFIEIVERMNPFWKELAEKNEVNNEV